jgi:hypothetical protein
MGQSGVTPPRAVFITILGSVLGGEAPLQICETMKVWPNRLVEEQILSGV